MQTREVWSRKWREALANSYSPCDAEAVLKSCYGGEVNLAKETARLPEAWRAPGRLDTRH